MCTVAATSLRLVKLRATLFHVVATSWRVLVFAMSLDRFHQTRFSVPGKVTWADS